MQNLISPDEVVASAFAPLDHITPEQISPLTIAVAQERFIVPVLGEKMVAAMLEGSYSELVDEWVAPALALYTRVLMMPMLAMRAGAAGVVKAGNQYLDAATEIELRAARREALARAATLLRKAVKTIEENAADYPEYNPAENIWNRCRTDGGVVL